MFVTVLFSHVKVSFSDCTAAVAVWLLSEHCINNVGDAMGSLCVFGN